MEVVETGLALLPPDEAAPLPAANPPLVAGRPAVLAIVNVATVATVVVTVNVIAVATANLVHQLRAETVLPTMTADVVQVRALPLVQNAAVATTMQRTATEETGVEAVQESGMMIRLRAPAMIGDGTWGLVLRPLNEVLPETMEAVLDRLRLVRGPSRPERVLSLLRFVLPFAAHGNIAIWCYLYLVEIIKKGLSVHTVYH